MNRCAFLVISLLFSFVAFADGVDCSYVYRSLQKRGLDEYIALPKDDLDNSYLYNVGKVCVLGVDVSESAAGNGRNITSGIALNKMGNAVILATSDFSGMKSGGLVLLENTSRKGSLKRSEFIFSPDDAAAGIDFKIGGYDSDGKILYIQYSPRNSDGFIYSVSLDEMRKGRNVHPKFFSRGKFFSVINPDHAQTIGSVGYVVVGKGAYSGNNYEHIMFLMDRDGRELCSLGSERKFNAFFPSCDGGR